MEGEIKEQRRARSTAEPDGSDRSIFEFGSAEFEDALRKSPERSSHTLVEGEPRLHELPEDELAELRALARTDPARAVRSGRKVLLLPGIMGSKLIIDEGADTDSIWIHLIRMRRGDLGRLSIAAGERVRAVDVIGVVYSPLRLRLRARGINAEFHPFDWRLDIRELGRELAEAIKASPTTVDLVAHSMGGLVARIALADEDAARKVERLITLGTPHAGSFEVTKAFDGTSSIARFIDRIDDTRDAHQLAGLFAEFPGLAMMLPDPDVLRTPDFAVPANWPEALPRPSDLVLEGVAPFRSALPGRVQGVETIAIVGVGHLTAIGASVGRAAPIHYTNGEGDGTVPLRSAAWPLADRTFYLEAPHGMMPARRRTAAAVAAILDRQEPGLATIPPAPRLVPHTRLADREADVAPIEDQEALEAALRPFLAKPDGSEADSPTTISVATTPCEAAAKRPARFRDATRGRFVAGAGSELRLEIHLRYGNLLDCSADCYALGLFSGVDPAGAALAIDAEMEGAVLQMVQHRMLGADVGEISVLPNGRHLLRAQAIAFVGLGAPASFRPETMEAVGTSLMRTMMATRMDEVAMVPFGTSAQQWSEDSFGFLIQGFVTALKENPANRFRALTFCDVDRERVAEVREWLRGICTSTLTEKVELVVDEGDLPTRQPSRKVVAVNDRAYLFLTQKPADGADEAEEERKTHAALLLPRGQEAAVAWRPQPARPADLNGLLNGLAGDVGTVHGIQRFGSNLAEMALDASVAEPLAELEDTHLVLVHGEFDSRLPWETLHVGGKAPALEGGVSHRYLAPNRSIAKWNSARDPGAPVRIFLIGNPTSDLPGAEEETKALEKLVAANPRLEIVGKLYREEATLAAVEGMLESTAVEILHYAGHAFFDQQTRANGGLLLAGNEVLTGRRVMALGRLPSLVFLNACEAARVRGHSAESTISYREAVEEQGSLAEVLLKAGVGNFVGTYWPVGDEAAKMFAERFYAKISSGGCLNEAVLAGRRELHDRSLPDWANYIFYGDPGFCFAEGTTR